jgi:hypothetical protein
MFHDEAKAERDHGQFNCNQMTSIKLSLDWIEMPKQAENLMHDKQRLRRSLSLTMYTQDELIFAPIHPTTLSKFS